ncbi:uncharacterized protein [Parasteatoda tepidariorum]|uniref:uncharacterized protein n=1 Tax=Parasteatoda tepidariorum TaxID=114398 RepID=UPI0039BCAE2F
MGRQRKKRCLKTKKEDVGDGTYESESVLNSGVANSSSVNESSTKLVSSKDIYRVDESPLNSGSLRTALSSSPRGTQPPTTKPDASTDVQRIEPMDVSNAEKEYSSTTEVRMQRTTLKVHISRCIRRRTWPNIKREPKEFKTSPEDLLMTYGVNAYQFWARNKNKDITKGSKRYKEDILAVPLHQWNKVLSSFIQTMTDPNERTLSGGAILYIVLAKIFQ